MRGNNDSSCTLSRPSLVFNSLYAPIRLDQHGSGGGTIEQVIWDSGGAPGGAVLDLDRLAAVAHPLQCLDLVHPVGGPAHVALAHWEVAQGPPPGIVQAEERLEDVHLGQAV